MPYDHSCLNTVVRNTSGETKTFSFLPPHGKELEDEQDYEIEGDLFEAIRHSHRRPKRAMDALYAALDAGDLEIISSPSPVILDRVTEQSKILVLSNNAVSADDPCYHDSISE